MHAHLLGGWRGLQGKGGVSAWAVRSQIANTRETAQTLAISQ